MKKILFALLLGSTLSLQSCGDNKKESDSVENAEEANEMKDDRGTGLDDDATEFAVKAANGGMMEVQLSQLALEKNPTPAIREYATMMIEEHKKANDELKALAAQKNITLPTTLGEDKQESYNEMAKLSGDEFNKKYVEMMLSDHQKTVDMFKEAADDNENADLKAFAAKTLPTLQMHLDKIKTLEDRRD